jgi:ABC-type Fe3+/spermidine/putrescine transport system ATPase subunit
VLSVELSRRLLGTNAAHSLRPERVRLDGELARDDEASLEGVVDDVQYLGSDSRVRVGLPDGSHLTATVPSHTAADIVKDDTVRMSFPRSAAFMVADTGTAVAEELADLEPVQLEPMGLGPDL